MNQNFKNIENGNGFSIIELIFALTVGVMVLLTAAKALDLAERAPRASATRAEALAVAQEAVEALVLIKNDAFACRCSVDACSGNTCTRSGDSQSCTIFPAYTSCWTAYPANGESETEFKISPSGGTWSLSPSPGADEVLRASPYLGRIIKIENARRDGAGNLDPAGTADPGSKIVTVTANYEDRGAMKSLEQKILLTAWENLN